MDSLTWISAKFDLEDQVARVREGKQKCPIEIPNANRETLTRIFFCLGFQRGVEVGVERGLYSETICREIPGVSLYCVDAWVPYAGYRDHVGAAKLSRFYEETQERLKPFKGATLIRKFSADAVQDFQDASLDFVYLDGNHNFESVTADLAVWSKKVRPGGIIAGHDYALHAWPNQIHVVQAVKGWTSAYDIRPWFVLGRQAKVEGELRDDARSWFWVHEPRPMVRRGERPIKQ